MNLYIREPEIPYSPAAPIFTLENPCVAEDDSKCGTVYELSEDDYDTLCQHHSRDGFYVMAAPEDSYYWYRAVLILRKGKPYLHMTDTIREWV